MDESRTVVPAEGSAMRIDLQVIADMVEPGTRVLDVGCGDGALLAHLVRAKQVDGRGIEISSEGVRACVSAGLSVIQGDADMDLDEYPDQAFDYVILGQTIQATRSPRRVLENLVRIGRHAVVSIPNFANWHMRWLLMTTGRMPITTALPYQWYDTPNIHSCTIKDFVELCDEMGITIERSISLDRHGNARGIGAVMFFANLFGEQAVFLLRKRT